MINSINFGLQKPEPQIDNVNIETINGNMDTIDIALGNTAIFETAGGTATAITLTGIVLENGRSKTFIVSSDNNGAATTINGKSLFKPGTTTAPKLLAGKAVTVWYNGVNFFIKASAEGDAIAENVLAEKTFSNEDDTRIVGTMVDNGPSVATTVNLTTEGAEYTIPKGYHSGLRKIKAVITGLIASVIKAGVTVGGILGTFTSDATATDIDVLSSKTYYRNGVKGTGSIASKTAQTYTPTTADQTIAANQYLSGAQTIKGDANLISSKILLNNTIFNITGTGVGINNCAQISALAATVGYSADGQITLNWANPGDGLIKGVRIMYKTSSYPIGPNDGTIFFDSNDVILPTTAIVTGLIEGTSYYICAFAYTYQNATRVYTTSTVGAKCTAIPYRAQGSQTFTSSGTFTVPAGCTSVDVFLVGGGGGSSGSVSGPSGAGGGYTLTHKAVSTVPGSTCAVIVGAGGAGASAGGASSIVISGTAHTANGGNSYSSFGIGGAGGSGGGGGGQYNVQAGSGGTNGSAGTNATALGSQQSCYAGGAGQGSTTKAWGDAGGTLYAGGGGGGVAPTGYTAYAGAGGAGGGGAGGVYNVGNGSSGTANSGGGAGSAYLNSSSTLNGGSGIVLVRWGY